MSVQAIQTAQRHTPQQSLLPLLMAFSILAAFSGAFQTYLSSGSVIEMLWSYSKTGSLALLLGSLIPLVAGD